MHHLSTIYLIAIAFLIAAVFFLRGWIVDLQEEVKLLKQSVTRLYDYGEAARLAYSDRDVYKTPAVIRKRRR